VHEGRLGNGNPAQLSVKDYTCWYKHPHVSSARGQRRFSASHLKFAQLPSARFGIKYANSTVAAAGSVLRGLLARSWYVIPPLFFKNSFWHIALPSLVFREKQPHFR
jgi:hypothetical protein